MTAMSFTRSLRLVVLCTAQIGHAAFAASFVPEMQPDAPQALEPVARKGTRTYMPDGSTTPVPADTSQAQAADTSEALEQCMATWDAGTHISKSNWRTICIRQLKDRDTTDAPDEGAAQPAR